MHRPILNSWAESNILKHICLLMKRNNWKKRYKSSALKSLTEGTAYELEPI